MAPIRLFVVPRVKEIPMSDESVHDDLDLDLPEVELETVDEDDDLAEEPSEDDSEPSEHYLDNPDTATHPVASRPTPAGPEDHPRTRQ
jgi:hypothetical protein